MTSEMNDLDPQEALEVQRLASALEAVESGRDPVVDAREDPELVSLLATAATIRETWSALTPAPDHAARSRSLTLALESMERTRGVEPALPANVIPFYRRWSVLSPVASAAAAAAITFIVTMFVISDAEMTEQQPMTVSAETATMSTRPSPMPLTRVAEPALSPLDETPAMEPVMTSKQVANAELVQDLMRIEVALVTIRSRAEMGEPVDAELLRTISEGTSRVAAKIAMVPDLVSPSTVATYFQSVSPGREILNSARVMEGDEAALETARVATWDGLSAVLRYFDAPLVSFESKIGSKE